MLAVRDSVETRGSVPVRDILVSISQSPSMQHESPPLYVSSEALDLERAQLEPPAHPECASGYEEIIHEMFAWIRSSQGIKKQQEGEPNDASSPVVASPRSQTAALLGRAVRIVGVATGLDLNGRYGHATYFDSSSGQYVVKLESNREVVRGVCPSNLELPDQLAQAARALISLLRAKGASELRETLAALPSTLSPQQMDTPPLSTAIAESYEKLDRLEAALDIDVLYEIKTGDVAAVSLWLDAGGDINETYSVRSADGKESKGITMLLSAAASGHPRMVRMLLNRGANVNQQDSLGFNALMMAVLQDNHQTRPVLLRELLRAGADVAQRLVRGDTVLDISVKCKRSAEVIAMLRAADDAASKAAAEARADEAMASLLAEEEQQQQEKQKESRPTERSRSKKCRKKAKKKKQDGGGAATAHASMATSESAVDLSTEDESEASAKLSSRRKMQAKVASERRDATRATAVDNVDNVDNVDDAKSEATTKAESDSEAAIEEEAEQERLEIERAIAQVAAEEKAEAVVIERALRRRQALWRAKQAAVAFVAREEQEEAAMADKVENVIVARTQTASQGCHEEQLGAASTTTQVAADEADTALPPDDFMCPITQELMVDPVLAADGHTYERKAIERWLLTKTTSPKTGLALEMRAVFPNHLVRRQIIEWQERPRQESAAYRL